MMTFRDDERPVEQLARDRTQGVIADNHAATIARSINLGVDYKPSEKAEPLDMVLRHMLINNIAHVKKWKEAVVWENDPYDIYNDVCIDEGLDPDDAPLEIRDHGHQIEILLGV